MIPDDFELSDSNSDIDFELKDFPEPYNTLGQFIMSTVVGALTNYIMVLRNNKIIDVKEYHNYINKYFNYCKIVNDDDYINQIFKLLPTDNNDYIDKICETTIIVADNVMLIHDNYSNYVSLNDKDFNIELLNIDIANHVISILDLNVLKEII